MSAPSGQVWIVGHSTHPLGRASAHQLTPFASVEPDGRITYPASTAAAAR